MKIKDKCRVCKINEVFGTVKYKANKRHVFLRYCRKCFNEEFLICQN